MIIIYNRVRKEKMQMEIFAERLRALREGMKLSQAQIADGVGTTQSSINRYEKSDYHHFKWWFEIAPERGMIHARLKGGAANRYLLPLKEAI